MPAWHCAAPLDICARTPMCRRTLDRCHAWIAASHMRRMGRRLDCSGLVDFLVDEHLPAHHTCVASAACSLPRRLLLVCATHPEAARPTCAICTASAGPLMVTLRLRVPATKSSRSEMRIFTPITLLSWLITSPPFPMMAPTFVRAVSNLSTQVSQSAHHALAPICMLVTPKGKHTGQPERSPCPGHAPAQKRK